MSDEPASEGDQDAGGPSQGASDGDAMQEKPPEPAWTRLIAPLRSEDAAFRMVVWAACAAVVFAAIVLLVRLLT